MHALRYIPAGPSACASTADHLFSNPRRRLHASCLRSGHYKTLGVPKDANRNQIKASFYKLSKEFHPDVNKDPTAKERFQAVSEAYAILGDDRQRRAYDRTLTSDYTSAHPHTHHEASHMHWHQDGRRRGATHAWEYSRRPNPGRHGQAYSYSYKYTYSPPPADGSASNPFSNPNVQKATGRRGSAPTGSRPTQADRVARESVFARTVQVAALVLLIATVGHGFSASAAS